VDMRLAALQISAMIAYHRTTLEPCRLVL
jgi:hypothetical protein